MIVKYFRDTDTALIEFSDAPIEETRELTDNVLVDFDKDGQIVGITIEHAAITARFPHVSVEERG